MNKKVLRVIRAFHNNKDDLGSYTGTADIAADDPIQDADDL